MRNNIGSVAFGSKGLTIRETARTTASTRGIGVSDLPGRVDPAA